MLVVVALASLWPSLAAARKTVSDILRYQRPKEAISDWRSPR